jgi:bacillithiol biosynthesis cysteine-adding enzyme BshC
MEPSCLRHSDLPGTSRLFTDFTYHFEKVARFYRHDPHDPAALRAAAAEIRYPDERRAAMVQALLAQNGPSESLDRLAKPGTVAIVTGQQVGLFSGPAYTVYKAITAARLARELTEQGVPAVPIFWLATEDHDFAEVNHAWIFGAPHVPVEVAAQADTNGRQRPVGGIVIDRPPVDELAAVLKTLPHGDEVTALVREAYQPGATLGGAFHALLKKILAKLDLIFLDPLDPAIRAISVPIVTEALVNAAELKEHLLDRNKELERAGYHAQVHLEEKTSLFFLLQNGERIPLRRPNSDFSDLRDRAAEVSPNALLRPVVQDFLLPTAAYIGGPAELAYLAQAEVIYDRLLGRMPVVRSRTSFTLVEPRTEKLFKRYGLSVPDTFVDPEHLREKIARALVPDSVERAFADANYGMTHNIECLHDELERFDHTLAASLAKAKAKMVYQLEKTRRKIERETMRRDNRAAEEARYLSGLLFPQRHLQERFYSILPFLAKHGLDLIDNLYDAAQLDCPDHHVLTI